MLKRLLHGIGANVVSQLATVIVQLSLVPVLASHWGIELYGVWLLLAAAPAYLALGDFGFATAAGTDMTMKVARGAHDAAVGAFQSATVGVAVGFGIILIVAMAAVWLVPDQLYADPAILPVAQSRQVLSILIVYGLASMLGSLLIAGFRCDGRYAVGAMCGALQVLIEGLAVIAVVLLGGGPLAAAVCYLVCRLMGLAVQAMLLRRLVPWLSFGMAQASWEQLRELMRPSLAVMALPAAQVTALQGTALAIGATAGAPAVAVFSSVRTLTRLGVQATVLVNHAVMPEFSAVVARGDKVGIGRLVALTLATSCAAILPVAAFLFAFGPYVISVWTHGSIMTSWSLIAVMTLVMLANGLWLPLSNLILATNRQSFYSYPYLGIALACLPIAYLLSGPLEALGGALAMLVLDVVMCALVTVLVVRHIAGPAEVARGFGSGMRALLARM